MQYERNVIFHLIIRNVASQIKRAQGEENLMFALFLILFLLRIYELDYFIQLVRVMGGLRQSLMHIESLEITDLLE